MCTTQRHFTAQINAEMPFYKEGHLTGSKYKYASVPASYAFPNELHAQNTHISPVVHEFANVDTVG